MFKMSKTNQLVPVLRICLRTHIFFFFFCSVLYFLFAACCTSCLQRVHLWWYFAVNSKFIGSALFYFVVSLWIYFICNELIYFVISLRIYFACSVLIILLIVCDFILFVVCRFILLGECRSILCPVGEFILFVVHYILLDERLCKICCKITRKGVSFMGFRRFQYRRPWTWSPIQISTPSNRV